MGTIRIEKKSLLLNEKPARIISGAMHYFRVHQDLWNDRLDKAVAFGLNCMETYCCWNLHEPKPGKFCFSGMLDLERYIRCIQEHGLYLILRPGPYICAEWENGGFPAWLMAVPGIEFRRMNKPYLDAVKRYFDELLPRIKPWLYTSGGPVIMMQIENEYASYGNDKAYLKFLYDLYRSHGIDVPLFTSDGAGGHYLHVGLPEAMMTVNFGSGSDEAWKRLHAVRSGEPDFCMEFWNGWFDHWGEEHHTRSAGMEEGGAARELDRMLSAGANVNLYMFHGGTNFGFCSGANGNHLHDYAPTVTSYDYDSPLSECGDPTDKFFACQAVIRRHFPNARTAEVKPGKKIVPPDVSFCGSTPLLKNLDLLASAHGRAVTPPTMEQLKQNFGFIHYRCRLTGPLDKDYELYLFDVNDYAMVWQDGRFLEARMRDTGEKPLKLHAVPAEGSTLDVLVENCGRINYGPYTGKDFKGIVGGVALYLQFQMNWEYWSLELEDLSGLRFDSFDPHAGPAFFHAAEFDLEETGDAFLMRPGKKGTVWINGFNLGRYWDRGPTQTLYVPAPVLKKGRNFAVILEQEQLESASLCFSTAPRL